VGLHGAPAKRYQKLTSGEFQKQHEIVIASCKSRVETNYQAVIYATVGFTSLFACTSVAPESLITLRTCCFAIRKILSG
jgi:hypothetical protein